MSDETALLVKVVSADGTQIAVWRSGDGPSLLLIHGAGGSHTLFRLITLLLARHFTVSAVDRRGRGASGDANAYSLGREFEDAVAVVNSLPEPVIVFGHSFGALVAAEAALLTGGIKALILYEGGPKPPGLRVQPELIERLERHIAQGEREQAVLAFVREAVSMPDEEIERLRGQPIWKELLATVDTLPREGKAVNAYGSDLARFRELQIPTLLIVGGASPSFRHEAFAAWKALFPRSSVAILPGQQHMAIETAPELLVAEVVRFIAASVDSEQVGVPK